MSSIEFNDIANTAKFIPVYFQGDLNMLNQTSWNNGTLIGSSSNTIEFISNIIEYTRLN